LNFESRIVELNKNILKTDFQNHSKSAIIKFWATWYRRTF